ncbi:hypothetical protein K0M31_007512 [Melipona bicolor]|uniref:Uncharacterized protein n=1 Tax=Melipona bicolor TaxID=60889 RepID=A0AA40GBW5_9HYME|nr:hypothetical protein K0M31_007512 [Melipona bicolor]
MGRFFGYEARGVANFPKLFASCSNKVLQELREMCISSSEDHVHSGDSWEIDPGKSPVYGAHPRVLY